MKYVAIAALGVGMCLGLHDLVWASEEAHGGGPPWGDFFQRLLNFAIMAGILIWLLKKPVSNYFTSRRETIQKTLADLEQKKKEAEKHCAEYKAKLAALDEETEKIVTEYIEEGEAEKQKIIAEAQKQAEYIKQQAQLAINQEIRAAREALQEEIAELSAVAAEDILKKNIRTEDQERLIQDFTTKVVEAK
jgi:F-type H+-transporting ATPase subunit b